MEVEKNGKLPFLGTELINHAPRIETKFYVKPVHASCQLLSKNFEGGFGHSKVRSELIVKEAVDPH